MSNSRRATPSDFKTRCVPAIASLQRTTESQRTELAMPCYLFTYHGYGTWMPDRSEGYVRRGEGVLRTSRARSNEYRRKAKETTVRFDRNTQRTIIEETLVAGERQTIRVHFVSTDTTHTHILCSWPDERGWKRLRSGVKSSLTRRLNREFHHREWFSEGGSRKQVKDRTHFDHLVSTYLPSHGGLKWSENDGYFH